MEITSFDVTPDKMVTLHMANMPLVGVRTLNTTVYIGATPLGSPEEVSGQRQIIRFSAASATQSGKIGVLVMLDDDQLEATSDTDYEYVPNVVVDTKPSVTSVSPRRAAPSGVVTLRGKNLVEVKVISLSFMKDGKILSVTINQVRPNPDGRSVMFSLPADIHQGYYLIGLGLMGGDRVITKKEIAILG